MTQQATENHEYWKQVGKLTTNIIARFLSSSNKPMESLQVTMTTLLMTKYTFVPDTENDTQQLTYLDWLLYQLNWDLGDFETAVNVRKNKNGIKEKHHDFKLRYDQESMLGSHCSVLVKVGLPTVFM